MNPEHPNLWGGHTAGVKCYTTYRVIQELMHTDATADVTSQWCCGLSWQPTKSHQ